MDFVFYDYPKPRSVFGLLVFGGIIAAAVFEFITTGFLDVDKLTPGRLGLTFGALYVISGLGIAFVLFTDGESFRDFLFSKNKIELTNEGVRIKGTSIPYARIIGVHVKSRVLHIAWNEREVRFKLNCADEVLRKMQARLDARS